MPLAKRHLSSSDLIGGGQLGEHILTVQYFYIFRHTK